jgi:hypothetical protein
LAITKREATPKNALSDWFLPGELLRYLFSTFFVEFPVMDTLRRHQWYRLSGFDGNLAPDSVEVVSPLFNGSPMGEW